LRILRRFLDEATDNLIEIRFESGHVMADGNLYKPALKEILFADWGWISMRHNRRNYDVREEKPKEWKYSQTSDPDKLIRDSNSLFSLLTLNVLQIFKVHKNSTPWALLCHDQPEEIADFIFIDADKTQRRLELVHVKAAAASGERRIAVGPYEKVVPQAV